jgi:hypothetical protein
MVFFDKNTFGRIISRFASDISIVHDYLTWQLQGVFVSTAYFLGFLAGIII